MRVDGLDRPFISIGENIHTTRIVLRKGRLVVDDPEGRESVRYYDTSGRRRYLPIPEAVKGTQDYEEGRVKHVKIAVQAAMSDSETDAVEGLEYIKRLIQRQEEGDADFLDLNVDEISLKPEEQKTAMDWLVRTVQRLSSTPVSVDSSNSETIETGLEACNPDHGRMLLNSASLERIDALDLARKYDAQVMVTATGEKGMPQNETQRVENASRMVEGALERGIAISDLYVDPLIFPISVDMEFGNHSLEAIRRLRQNFDPEIHISGGFSNVSFGLPVRRLVNDVFFLLAIEAGADSGIIDPVTSNPKDVFSLDRSSVPYQLAQDMLLGKDRNCKAFLKAYRKGELS